MAQIRISTTGSDVTINDLGGLEFNDPVVNEIVYDSDNPTKGFSLGELMASDDLKSEVSLGNLTLSDDTGDGFNTVRKAVDNIKARVSVVEPNQLTTSEYSYNPTQYNDDTTTIIVGSNRDRNAIHGIPAGWNGRMLTIINKGDSKRFVVRHNSPHAPTGETIQCPSRRSLVLDVNSVLTIQYFDSINAWRVISYIR